MTTAQRSDLEQLLTRFGLPLPPAALPTIRLAFVHASYRTETGAEQDNERLEFLGDSVVGLVTTEYLLRQFPHSNEGELSKRRAALVSRDVLGQIAEDLHLGDLLLLGTGEERSGGRHKKSTLGSALEALIGALYLHAPWEEVRRATIDLVVAPALELEGRSPKEDHKSRLQEWTQLHHKKQPRYRLVSEEGPDHLKHFRIEVLLDDHVLGMGEGKNKKSAENDAARDALTRVGGTPAP